MGPGASMRWGGRAAAVLLAAAVCAAPCGALAEVALDEQILNAQASALSPPATAAAPDQSSYLWFSTTDLWRQGGFSHGGLLWAPNGFDRDGVVLKLMLGGGVYRYTSGALGNVNVRGEELAGALLPGWR